MGANWVFLPSLSPKLTHNCLVLSTFAIPMDLGRLYPTFMYLLKYIKLLVLQLCKNSRFWREKSGIHCKFEEKNKNTEVYLYS